MSGVKNSFSYLFLYWPPLGFWGAFLLVFLMPHLVLAYEAKELTKPRGMVEIERTKKAIGWHWYNEINELYPEENKEQKNHESAEDKKTKKSAVAQMDLLRKAVREAKAKAILYPTEENVRSYIVLQNFVVGKASVFTQVWQKTLLDYPELDYSVSHPTQSSVQHILSAETRKKEDEAIQAFSKKYGMFFFYHGNDPIDQTLAPIIESFSRENHIPLLPVAMDGKTLEVLGNKQQINRGQAERLGVKYFPALILVDPQDQKVQPLYYGFVAESDLRKRFLQIATDFQNDTENK